jgi:tetratricopeptide (TPR) repeat protein
MNANSDDFITRFSKKIGLIGREEEIALFHDCLKKVSASDYLYFKASGGVGKTRLLENFREIVCSMGEGYRCTEIIDLYHTDTHSTSDVERIIVEYIDPGNEYFKAYRKEREQYAQLRERGADPTVLEDRRKELSKTFVQEWDAMRRRFLKLVLFFDTLEVIQYESSVVEERAGLDTVDARVKPWLLSILPQLNNVLVVFAGRPKAHAEGQTVDHQQKLEEDMLAAFSPAQLQIRELKPLHANDIFAFIRALNQAEKVEVIPEALIPIVHRLTDGKPIYVHLLYDLVRHFAMETRAVLEMFEQYAGLTTAPEGDPELAKVQGEIRMKILDAIFRNEEGAILTRIGMLPKGVDSEILEAALGMPQREVRSFLSQILQDLHGVSFVKRSGELRGGERIHQARLFLHDEMYLLLNLPGVIRDRRLNERTVAQSVIANYYDPRIKSLEEEIHSKAIAANIPERVALRERLQKLQVERLYYLLVRDVMIGFEEYRRLSNQANRRREVGFGMRLLDEFLRFYNDMDRRRQFEEAGISHEQVVRESTLLWVERFRWWGQAGRQESFAGQVLEAPQDFNLRPAEDADILALAAATWGMAFAHRHGYSQQVVEKLHGYLEALPADDRQERVLLARARLCNTLGYLYRRNGELDQAARYYIESKTSYRQLGGYDDELVLTLNNLAYVYALQAHWPLALSLSNEAYRLADRIENSYSAGLARSTMAAIEGLHGKYSRSIEIADSALKIFQELGDEWGIVLVRQNIAYARRHKAKSELDQERDIDEAVRLLDQAREEMEKALNAAQGFKAQLPILYMEMGRVCREQARAVGLQGGDPIQEARLHHESQQYFLDAINSGTLAGAELADALEDLAEEYFYAHLPEEALAHARRVEEIFGQEYLIVPGRPLPGNVLAIEYFRPLGNVERLRGTVCFDGDELYAGLQHFCLASIYFGRFPRATEIENMLQGIYHRLQELGVDQQKELVGQIEAWVEENHLQAEAHDFTQNLRGLVGEKA